MSTIPSPITSKMIRNYKHGVCGNYFDFISAVQDDATNYVGRDPALLKIEARKNGNGLSNEENDVFNYAYFISLRDAKKMIVDQVYSVVPDGIKNCGLFRAELINY